MGNQTTMMILKYLSFSRNSGDLKLNFSEDNISTIFLTLVSVYNAIKDCRMLKIDKFSLFLFMNESTHETSDSFRSLNNKALPINVYILLIPNLIFTLNSKIISIDFTPAKR